MVGRTCGRIRRAAILVQRVERRRVQSLRTPEQPAVRSRQRRRYDPRGGRRLDLLRCERPDDGPDQLLRGVQLQLYGSRERFVERTLADGSLNGYPYEHTGIGSIANCDRHIGKCAADRNGNPFMHRDTHGNATPDCDGDTDDHRNRDRHTDRNRNANTDVDAEREAYGDPAAKEALVPPA